MGVFITFWFVFNILKATVFSITYLVMFVLPIFVWYVFYNRYLNKAWLNNLLTTWNKFLHIVGSNFIAWIVHFIALFILTYITLKYNIEFLKTFSSFWALLIMAVAYYISLKTFLSKQEWINDKDIKEISSNTTWATFWIFILLLIIIWFTGFLAFI